MLYLASRRFDLRASLLVAASALASACSNDVGDLFGGAGGTAPGSTSATSASSGETSTATSTSASSTSVATASSSSTGVLPTCGDNMVQPPEPCDGLDLAGADCTDGGFSKPGGAACTPQCQLSFDGCTATCGDNHTEPGETCDDGNTKGGDGCSPTCQIEVDPCAAPVPIALPLGSMSLAGTTSGPSFHTSSTCGGGGPEAVYAVTMGASGFFTAWLTNAGTAFDASLYVRTTCGSAGSETICDDNDGGNNRGGDLISYPVGQGDTVYVFVDGFGPLQSGAYALELDLSVGEDCNDPVPLTLELGRKVAVRGSTQGFVSDAASEGCFQAGAGPDVVYHVIFQGGGGQNRVDVAAGYNSVVHAQTTCTDLTTEVACNNGAFDDSSISFNEDDVFVFVDGTSDAQGEYALSFP